MRTVACKIALFAVSGVLATAPAAMAGTPQHVPCGKFKPGHTNCGKYHGKHHRKS
jgi:hypothetical protein